MRSAVVIKSSRAGMTVILDPQIPFEELLAAVGKKFRESARFWGSAQMTLTLEGRELTPAEELAIVDAITRNSQIEVLCLLDTNAERIERCEKALNDKLMELNSQTGQFYRGNLRRGDALESEASIVVIGDVEHGANPRHGAVDVVIALEFQVDRPPVHTAALHHKAAAVRPVKHGVVQQILQRVAPGLGAHLSAHAVGCNDFSSLDVLFSHTLPLSSIKNRIIFRS